METFIIYFAKASGLTALFFLAYTLLLKKETFFTPNRMFLLAGIFTSALLPLMVYTKIVLITPEPVLQMPLQQITLSNLMVSAPQMATPEPFTINWLYVAGIAYTAGLLFFTIHFLIDLYKVRKMLRGRKVVLREGFRYIDSESVESPFSFFKYIVYNSVTLQPQELENIIAHERVHSSQKHSLDVLISQLFCIIFWFNPFAWLYKKAISQNLEFIADSVAAKQVIDVKAYQKTLLKITMHPQRIAITNHFYQSLIKKRIVMLNKQQSKRRNFYKFALIVPALIAFVLLYQVEVLAQEKEPEKQKTTTATSTKSQNELRIIMEVTSTATDKELKEDVAIFKQQFNANVVFTNVKRNAKGEITNIKATVKDKDHTANYPIYEVSGDASTPITPFTVDIQKDEKTGKNIINFGHPNSETKIKMAQGFVSKDSIAHGTDAADLADQKTNDDAIPSDVLYIIDGFIKGSEAFKNLDPNSIEKIEVLKNNDELMALYGKEAKNGVIRITTRKKTNGLTTTFSANKVSSKLFDPNSPAFANQYTVVTYNSQPQTITVPSVSQSLRTYTYTTTHTINNKTKNREDIISNLLESSTVDYKKAYILINGKQATPEELEKVNPKKVNITSVTEGNELLIAKYGEKATNGVITVDLKGYESEISKMISSGVKDVTDRKNIIEDNDNVGYIIHKKTSKNDIKFYIKSLKDLGIEAKITNIERNEEKQITSISIELVDKKSGDVQKASYTNDRGIMSIYVGRKDGKPVAYGMGK